MSPQEYTEIMNELMAMMENPVILQTFMIAFFVMEIVSVVICWVIARSMKLSWKFMFLGLLGMTGIYMLLCRWISNAAGMSKNYMWLGLFGIYGIIITVVIMIVTVIQKNNELQQNYHQRNQYGQNSQNAQEHKDEQTQNGYYLNGEYHEREQQSGSYIMEDKGSICLNCGSAVEAGVKICPRCGSRVK